MSTLIHISVGGPTYAINATKVHYFEDHPYCGPMLCDKKGNAVKEPPPTDIVWNRINAWYRQGKQYEVVAGIRWCKFKTAMQESRELALAARAQKG